MALAWTFTISINPTFAVGFICGIASVYVSLWLLAWWLNKAEK